VLSAKLCCQWRSSTYTSYKTGNIQVALFRKNNLEHRSGHILSVLSLYQRYFYYIDFTFSFSVIRRLKKEFVFNWRRLDDMFDCDVGTPTSRWTMHFYFRVKYQYLFHLETSVFCVHLYNKYHYSVHIVYICHKTGLNLLWMENLMSKWLHLSYLVSTGRSRDRNNVWSQPSYLLLFYIYHTKWILILL
jgi:hypothetical protein